MRLSGKVAIITGGGAGIGQATAYLFAKEGAKLVIADINDTAGAETLNTIKSTGAEAIFVHTDVSKASDMENLINKTMQTFGKIDILFNNAAIVYKGAPVEEIEESRWDKIFSVNVKGMFLGVKYAVPKMKAAGGGVIINACSIGGVRPTPFAADYESSKGAVAILTRALAVELAPNNIRVNYVIPGTTDTNLPRTSTPPGMTQEEDFKRRTARIPLGRIAKPIDIAYAVLYLASDESSMVTGAGLHVDGGRGV
jgi:NAD(P)-dependent dehydrogenase (short-subunit alcohol dehydrogenase family)